MPTDGNVFVVCDDNIPVFEDSYLFCDEHFFSDDCSMDMSEFYSKDDVKAINKYHASLSSSDGYLNDDENALLHKWLQLSTSEQAVFYDSVYQENVDEKAREIFLQECKEVVKIRVKGTYCLECDYKNLNEMEKEPYYEKAKQVLKAEKEADAKQKIDDGSRFISNRAILLNNGMYECSGDIDKRSFVLYCRKMRPQLLLEPRMFDKYYFQQILILEDRWRKLSKAEKDVYYALDARKRLILAEMSERELNDCDVSNRIGYDEDKEEEYIKEAKRNRIQLVKDFPDFYELVYEGPECSCFSLQENDDDSESEYGYFTKNNDLCNNECFTVDIFAELADTNAFQMFKQEVCPHENGYKNSVLWDKWFELTESKQEEYYEKSDNKRWEERALVLYENDKIQSNGKCELANFEKDRQIWIEKAKGTYTPDAFVELQIPEDSNLWIEDLYSTYCPKFLWIYPSMEDKAIYSHVYYKWLKIRIDPEVKEKRIIRICRKLEEEFRNFSPEVKEQKYAEIRRNQELYDEAKKRVLTPGKIYKKEMEESRPDDDAEKIWETWRNLSDDEKAVYDEKAKQARMQLMEDFPDFNNYFYWEKSWCEDGDRLCDVIGENSDCADDDGNDGDDDILNDDDDNVSNDHGDDETHGDHRNDAGTADNLESPVIEANHEL